MFFRYVLRTTDSTAARAFYAEALGLALPDGRSETSALEAWPLHEQALARRAVPHWLGQLAVDDVAGTVDRLIALGSVPLGPTAQAPDGTSFATLRDPFGSPIGVRTRGGEVDDSPVAWHQLHTHDIDSAWGFYHQLFGWAQKQTLDVPGLVGGVRLFAWNEAAAAVGGMSNSARLPGVHTHWLFFLPVGDLDEMAARVRARGGTALAPLALPGGMRLVACEDPQGAAFGLAQTTS